MVSIAKVHLEKPELISAWMAHKNAVFGIEWTVDGSRLITVSGDQSAVLWDVERKRKISVFKGHGGSIKTLSACPFDSNRFVTGSRDGAVMVWDARNRVTSDNDGSLSPVDVVYPGHFNSEPSKPSSARARRNSSLSASKQRTIVQTALARRGSNRGGQDWRSRLDPLGCECGSSPGFPASVSAVLYHTENFVASGATTRTGIRLWDLRRTHKNVTGEPVPYHTFIHPRLGARQRGYTCFCTDRYRSKLYAACTDSCIYEFSLSTLNSRPSRQLRGSDIDSFYIQIAASPVEDFLVSGSSTGLAQIWDVSEPFSRRSRFASTDTGFSPVNTKRKFISGSSKNDGVIWPSWSLDCAGSKEEVTCVAWNSNSEMFVTCTDWGFRLWRSDIGGKESASNSNPSMVFRPVPFVKETKDGGVSEQLESMVVSPKNLPLSPPGSPVKNSPISLHQLTKKRKLPFRSPLKELPPPTSGLQSPSKAGSASTWTNIRSPIGKKQRFVSDGNNPVADLAASATDSLVVNRDTNPFYYPTPTLKLPNLVLERFERVKEMGASGCPKAEGPVRPAASPGKKLFIKPKVERGLRGFKNKENNEFRKGRLGKKEEKPRRSVTLHDFFFPK